MKRKLLTVFLTLAAVLCLTLGLAACGNIGGEKDNSGTTEDGGSEHVHTYTVDNVCSVCGEKWEYTEGLAYELDTETDTYVVTGPTADAEIKIPCGYQGKFVTKIGMDAFSHCTWIESITIPNTILEIGRGAFSWDRNLTKVTISDLVSWCNISFSDSPLYYGAHLYLGDQEVTELVLPKEIREIKFGAFAGCSGIRSVILPYGVTEIGEYAFEGCSELASVEISDSVTSIGDSAFSRCSGLTSVSMGNSVKSIGISAFSGCSSLTSITIPNNVTSISYAFSGCTELTNVVWNAENCTVPAGYVTDRSIFSGCPNLKSVTFGKTVKVIPSLAFYDCDGLTSVEIPDGVTEIGWAAFYGCSSLASIEIPDSVTSINSSAFNGTAYYNDQSHWDTSGVLYIGNHLIDLKETISGDYTIRDNTKTIADYAFSGCSSLTRITIPESVTSIGEGVFSDCNSLERIEVAPDNPFYHSAGNCLIGTESKILIAGCNTSTIPSDGSVTSIGSGAFSGCSLLENIMIPDSVTEIGENAFYGCSGLTSITIPDGVTSIGEDAFYGCSGLTSVTLGTNSALFSVGKWAFSNCGSLTSIEIPNSVTLIEDRAFYSCSALTSVTLGENSQLTSIGSEAFSNCSSLESITIPDSVTWIGESAFYGCNSLTSIKIPASVTLIGDYAFEGCDSLENVTVDESNPNYSSQDGILYNKAKTEFIFIPKAIKGAVTIPDSVTSIGNNAFSGCSGLTSVRFGNSVTSIGYMTFSGCSSLTIIVIPDSVTSIGNNAFSGCSSLTSVTIGRGVTEIGDRAFRGCLRLTEVWNYSDLEIAVGDFQNGEVGRYAKQVYTTDEASKQILTDDGYLFYEDETDSYLIGYFGDETELTLPAKSPKGRNYQINPNAFYGCRELTSVEIPDGVTSIGYWAFYWCSSLESIQYKGTVDQWNLITKEYYWDDETGNYTITCTDGTIDKNGNVTRN